MKPSPTRFPKNLWHSCTIGSSSSAASTISHSLVPASQSQQGCSEVELRQTSICIDGTHSYITLKNVEQSCIPATCESGFSKHFHKILQKRPEGLFVYHCTTHLYNVMHPANFALLSFSHFPIHSLSLSNQELEIFKNVTTELFFLFNIQLGQKSSYIGFFSGRPLFCKIQGNVLSRKRRNYPHDRVPVSLEISHEISPSEVVELVCVKKGCKRH